MKKIRTAIGLDLGGQTVKYVRISMTPQGLRVEDAALYDWPPVSETEPKEKADALREWLHSRKMRGGRAVIAVSGSFCNVQLANFPKSSDAALQRMVKLESQRLAGISEQEVASDYLALPSSNGQARVLMALCRATTINKEIEFATAAGFTVDDVTFSNLALNNAFHFKPTGDAKGLVAYADIGRDSTNIALVQDGLLRFARSFASGGGAFTLAVAQANRSSEAEAERWKREQGQLPVERAPLDAREEGLVETAENWLKEFNDTLTHFLEENGGGAVALDRVVLAGGGALMGNFALWLSRRLNKPVEIGAPLNASGADVTALSPELKNDPRLAIALGLAIQGLHETPSLSLLPFAVKEKREVLRHTKQLVAYSAMVALIFLTTLAAVLINIRKADARIEMQRQNLLVGRRIADAIDRVRKDTRRTTEMLRPVAELANRGHQFMTVWRDVSAERDTGDWFTLFADTDLYYLKRSEPGAVHPFDPPPLPTGKNEDNLSSVILEGYTPQRNLSSVTRLTGELERKYPHFKKVDSLVDDRRVADPRADALWIKTNHRRFTLELQLDWSRKAEPQNPVSNPVPAPVAITPAVLEPSN